MRISIALATASHNYWTQRIRALSYQRRKCAKRRRIGEVLRYFRHNRYRMRYAQTKARHLPIGSGIVEAACKTFGLSAAEMLQDALAP